jgi:hypothetical protein
MEFSTNKNINVFRVISNLKILFPDSSINVLKFQHNITMLKILGDYTEDKIQYFVTHINIEDLDTDINHTINDINDTPLKIGTHVLFKGIKDYSIPKPFIEIKDRSLLQYIDILSKKLNISYTIINKFVIFDTYKYNQIDINRMFVQTITKQPIQYIKDVSMNISNERSEKNRSIIENVYNLKTTSTLEVIDEIF